jgi:hypothetical protein
VTKGTQNTVKQIALVLFIPLIPAYIALWTLMEWATGDDSFVTCIKRESKHISNLYKETIGG